MIEEEELFECPVCGSTEADMFYFHDGECIGCELCVDMKCWYELNGCE